DTVATAWSLELQVTARFVSAAPLASRVVAVATVDSPVISDDLVRETLTDATGICDTLIEALPLRPSLVATIVAAPGLRPLTRPAWSTVATASSLEDQTTGRPVRELPWPCAIDAVACAVPAEVIVCAASATLTGATGTGLTEIETLEVALPADAVIVAVPTL